MTTMKDKTMKLYMHTLNGQPAQYEPGKQIHCAGFRGVTKFASSLRQIRNEQMESIRWRIAHGIPPDTHQQDYVLLRVTSGR